MLFCWTLGAVADLEIRPLIQYKILALVGTDDLKYGWILSRSPLMSIDDFATLEEEIRRQGYDSCTSLTSVQDGAYAISAFHFVKLLRNERILIYF